MSKLIVYLCIVAVIVCSAFVSAQDVDETHVTILTADNFEAEVLNFEGFVLAEFYAPWCGHCKKLKPEFAQAATELKDAENLKLAKMDCTDTDNAPVCQKFGVSGYPTLKIFAQEVGEPFDYKGGRTADAIVKELSIFNKPAFVVLNTEAEVKALNAEEPTLVVGFFESEEAAAENFKKVADVMKIKYTFVIATTTFGSFNAGEIALFRSFDEAAVLAEVGEEEALFKWILKEAFPVFGEIGPENYADYAERGLPFVWVFIDPEMTDFATLEASMNEVCKNNVEDVVCCWVDGVKWASHAEFLGANPKVLPAVVIEVGGAEKALFVKPENFNYADATEITSFVDQWKAGDLSEHVKSGPVPTAEEQAAEAVHILVSSQFDEEVLNSGKDVLIEFYAPWCGHCKNLIPIYEEVAQYFANDDNILIAKVDGTVNDIKGFNVEGFPTIFFSSAANRAEKTLYKGGRTVDDFIDYINENRSTPVASEVHTEL